MEDLLIAILQGIFEFLIEIFGFIPFDWPSSDRDDREPQTITGKCFAWFAVGCGLAWLSLLLLKRTWISHPTWRIVNLVAAPILSAFISEAIARRRARNNPFIIPRNHFWQAFWFTLGMVAVRFTYVLRH